MSKDITLFTIEKTLEGLMVKNGLSRINLVPDGKVLPGYAVRQMGNVVNVHPVIFEQMEQTTDQTELIALMKGLRVV